MIRPTLRQSSRTLALFAIAAAVLASQAASAADDKLARGKYLVTVAGCNDCHTPWKMGPTVPSRT